MPLAGVSGWGGPPNHGGTGRDISRAPNGGCGKVHGMPPKLTLRQFLRETKPLWEIGLGGVLAIFLLEAAIHLQWIATNITGNTRIIIILATCSGLYLIRHFSRLAYGFLEILVGMFVIVGTMSREPELVDPGLLLVQLAAGMYVIIRGFDNFAQSAPFAGGSAAFKALWNLLRRRSQNKYSSRPLQ